MDSTSGFSDYVERALTDAGFEHMEVLEARFDSRSFGNASTIVRTADLVFRIVRDRGDEIVELVGPAFVASVDLEAAGGLREAPQGASRDPEPLIHVLRRLAACRPALERMLSSNQVVPTLRGIEGARYERGVMAILGREPRSKSAMS